MARAVRASRAQTSLYADGSDSDDDVNVGGDNSDYDATPKAKKPSANAKGKKRVSDAYHHSNSYTNGTVAAGSSPSRVPLKAVNINDDEAEKRKRRKSAKLAQPMMSFEDESQMDADTSGAGPSSQDQSGRIGDTPRARQLKQKQQLMSVAETPVINVPLDVMSSNFEEWMKMATDNKINATNSWNFALIDYFHDMSLLRNNQDNSINFQKASCTLDGCVKIWTSRVDSVGTETGRLLSNLANEGKVDNEDGDLSDNPDSGDPSQRNKRSVKTQRQEATLAKNIAQLKSKKLDLEFSVDPLFKKTCADFDEGGAQGLLMNHLSLGVGSEGSLRVIFDASDSMGKGKDDEDEDDLVEPIDEIDLTHLRSEFLPDVSSLDDKAISHSLEGFSFTKDTFGLDSAAFFNATYVDDAQDDDDDFGDFGTAGALGGAIDADGGIPGGDAEDFFVGDQAVDEDYGAMGMGDDMPGGDGDDMGDNAMENEAQATQQGVRLGGFEPFDPRRVPNERDLILAMTEPGAEGSSLDYFDQTFLKNWAGPEHWKLRKVIRKPDMSVDTTANKTRREKKEPFKIDFLTPATKPQKEIMKEIFAPVNKGGSITLPHYSKSGKKGARGKGKDKREKRTEQTLPDDMHFSSRQLVTLFLKPKFALKMRGQRARLNDRDGEVDENFWAQAAADQAAGRRADDEDPANPGAIPFNTQFFHDDYDEGGGFDDVYDGDGDGPISGDGSGGVSGENDSGDRDLLSETQGLGRKVRPEMMNYAKRAKRVDVRKLKDNIWKGLDIVVLDNKGEDDSDNMVTDDTRPPTDPTEARTFTSVVSDLERSYPKDKLEEISTSFCFICLLHLANERGLKIELGKEDAVNEKMDDSGKVGDIFGLKVYRDPTAVPSA